MREPGERKTLWDVIADITFIDRDSLKREPGERTW